jgi:hypothetical protein
VAVRVWLAARSAHIGDRSALSAFIVVILTFLVGVATMFTGNDWLSFLMSVGFVAAAALYLATAAAAFGERNKSVAG